MADMEAVYKYGSTDGEVLARHEIGADKELPSVGDTIPLPGSSGGEKRFVVTAFFPGVSGGVKGEVPTSSTYIIVVEDAER
jgi:hypothetical protein